MDVQTLMSFLAGAGLQHFVAAIDKLKKTMGGSPENGRARHGPAGAAAGAPGAPPINPALAAMMRSGQPPAPASPLGVSDPAGIVRLIRAMGGGQGFNSGPPTAGGA